MSWQSPLSLVFKILFSVCFVKFKADTKQLLKESCHVWPKQKGLCTPSVPKSATSEVQIELVQTLEVLCARYMTALYDGMTIRPTTS